MQAAVYRSTEFLSRGEIKALLTKLRAYYGDFYVHALEEADHFGGIKGRGKIPKLDWGADVRLLHVYMDVELESQECPEQEFAKMFRSFIRSGLLDKPNTALSFFSIDGAFNLGRRRRENPDFSIGAQIEKSAESAGILYQFRYSHWSGKCGDIEQEVNVIRTVIERSRLPMTLSKVKGKHILSAPNESGVVEAGPPDDLGFSCFFRNSSPGQLAKCLCSFAEAVGDSVGVDWSWSINQDEDPNDRDKAARLYTWVSNQDFPSGKYEISLSYQIKGLQALGFLKSIAGPRGALDLEVAQIQWPDDWHAILKARTTQQGYTFVIEIKHDELKKIIAELKRVLGIKLIED